MSLSVIAARALIALMPFASPAFADSAYIQQVIGTTTVTTQSNSVQVTAGQQYTTTGPGRSTVPVPELTASRNAVVGSNLARSLTVGTANSVAQFQTGGNAASIVSTLGSNNTVGVVQGSDNISNLAVAGTGLNVAVLQPANSAPINMFVARLPNGTILIKR